MQNINKSRRQQLWRPAGATLLAMAAIVPAASAADQSTLSGDWGGARTRYREAGVNLRGDYVSETFANVSGGLKRGSLGPVNFDNAVAYYVLVALLAFGVLYLIVRVVRSPFGHVLVAIRENQLRATFQGYPVDQIGRAHV